MFAVVVVLLITFKLVIELFVIFAFADVKFDARIIDPELITVAVM